MDKINDAAYCKAILQDVLAISYTHISDLGNQLHTYRGQLDELLKDPETNKDAIKNLQHVMIIRDFALMYLNDSIHPLYTIARQLYPKAAKTIDAMQENHKNAIKVKALPACLCFACKLESMPFEVQKGDNV